MNKFIKRTAALLATSVVFACGGCVCSGAFAGDISADAYTQRSDSLSVVRAQASSTGAVISWDKQSDVKTYSVYLKKANGALELLLNTGDDAVFVTGLAPQTKYSYVVTGHTDNDDVMLGEASVTTIGADDEKLLDRNAESMTVKGLEAFTGIDYITLEWEHMQGIMSYELYTKDESGKLTLVKTTYSESVTFTGLETGKPYTFVVKGRAAKSYTKPAEITAAAQKKQLLQSAPGDITQVSVEDITVQQGYDNTTISWVPVEGVDTYNIYIGDDTTGFRFVTSTKGDSAYITGLAPLTEYTFLIRGQTSGRFTQNSYVPVTTLGFEDALVSGIKTTEYYDGVTVSWNKLYAADSYDVYSKDKNGKYTLLTTVTATSASIEKLSPNTEYTFAVRAHSGSKLSQLKDFTFTTLTLEKSKVRNVTATVTESAVTISWTLHKDVDAYNVYLYADGKYTYLTYSRTGSATVTGLKAGTAYTFVVRGQTGSRYTDFSPVRATTLRADVTIKFEMLNQLGGTGNSGSVRAIYGCGGTSVTMLLNEKGLNLNKDDVLRRQYTNGWCAAFCAIPFPYGAYSWGSVLGNLADLVKSYGFTPHVNTAPEMIQIKRLLNDNKLLLVGLRTAKGSYHFQIIYGYYVKNGVTYFRVHDPYGNYCVEWEESYLKKRIYAVDTTDPLSIKVRGIMWL